MKTYKFKLYRSKRNKYLDKLLSTACDIYNFSLSYKKNLYTNDKININKNDLQKVLTQLKDTDGYQYWNDLGSQVIQDITDRIYKGYNLFFLNLKNKGSRKVSPPKFKKKSHAQSIRYQMDQRNVLNNYRSGELLKLPKLGELKVKWSQVPGSIPKMVTVSKSASGKYFVSFMCEVEQALKPVTGKIVGIDVG